MVFMVLQFCDSVAVTHVIGESKRSAGIMY